MSGIKAASGLLPAAKMSEEEYRTHCEVIGRIIASSIDKGQFWKTAADAAVENYMKRVGIQDGQDDV